MGNKQQLQLNNETLASILSNVLGLPSQESLKHGAYVWKKYATTPIYVENSSEFYQKVVITEPQNAAITYEFSTTYTFDKNTGLFTLGNGGGIRIAYDSSGTIDEPSKYYMIGTRTGTTMYKNDGSSCFPTLYNNAGGVTILAYNDSHLVTEYQSELIHEKSDFIEFVVSGQETAYPDGGEQGGYWYEKVKGSTFGYSKVEFGEFTLAADAITADVNHSLGEIPRAAYLITPEDLIGVNSLKSITALSHAQSGSNNMTGGVVIGSSSYSSQYYYNNTSMLATDTMITFKTSSSYKMKAGKTYYYMLLA